MTTIDYGSPGRGAWPTGGYKRTDPQLGLIGARAVREGKTVDVNDYAVHRAVAAIQAACGLSGAAVDGIFGPRTEAAVAAWQARASLSPDGSFGPRSARAAFEPVAMVAAFNTPGADRELARVVVGLANYESRWDPGAVGSSDNTDLGIGQINAVHGLAPQTRLDPHAALSWIAAFAQANIKAMRGNVRDSVAAYNLGVGGARSWVAAGRPDEWPSGARKINAYIDAVLRGPV